MRPSYYHWFFLIQPDGLPERLIQQSAEYYIKEILKRWSAPGTTFSDEAVSEYLRCFTSPDTIHTTCEDYRAGASIDLEHDEQDLGRQLSWPLLVLWGAKGFVQRQYDVIEIWQQYADQVVGRMIDCGHFLPEEKPAEVQQSLLAFFK